MRCLIYGDVALVFNVCEFLLLEKNFFDCFFDFDVLFCEKGNVVAETDLHRSVLAIGDEIIELFVSFGVSTDVFRELISASS